MNIKINGKNIEITNAMETYLKKRMKYFDKFLKEDTPVTFSVSKRGNNIKIEVYLQYFKKDVKARIEGGDFYQTTDKLVDIMKSNISDLHKKMTDRNKKTIKDHYKKEQLTEMELLENEEDSK